MNIYLIKVRTKDWDMPSHFIVIAKTNKRAKELIEPDPHRYGMVRCQLIGTTKRTVEKVLIHG